MNVLSSEIYRMHNPALGAVVLWHFARAYSQVDGQKHGVSLPLCFLVLPMIWHNDTVKVISSTRANSGLRKFVSKYTETEAARDVLLAIHPRAMRWRNKTKASMRLGFSTGLFGLEGSRVISLSSAVEPTSNSTQSTMTDAAEKLGLWFAGMSVQEVGLSLRVRF